MVLDLPIIGGTLLALLAAGAATAWDCKTVLAQATGRVPSFMVIHPGVVILCSLCGIIAALAYNFTDPNGGDVVSTALTLKIANPVWRGVMVGVTILVLLRSKLFNAGNSGFGGEAIYTFFRDIVTASVNARHGIYRNRFLTQNEAAAFAMMNYFTNLEAEINRSITYCKPEYQQKAKDELKAVKSGQPTTAASQADPLWDAYYRAMTGICYDYCGPEVLQAMTGFTRLPRPGRWG